MSHRLSFHWQLAIRTFSSSLLCLLPTTASTLLADTESAASKSKLCIVADWSAPEWDKGHPIGNGRLGMLSLGAWPRETLYLNENTIWARQEFRYPKDGAQLMQRIRGLAAAGKYQEADRAWKEGFLEPMWRPASYEFAGTAVLTHLDLEQPLSIRNTLDLRSGISLSEAQYEDGTTIREAIALRERDLIAIRIATTRPGGIGLRIEMDHPRDSVSRAKDMISISGQGASGGTAFKSRLRVLPQADDFLLKRGNALEVQGGSEVLLLIHVVTDYNHHDPGQPRAGDWQEESLSVLAASAAEDWQTLREEAAREMRSFMDRFSIDLGASPVGIEDATTATRLKRYYEGATDPDLEELLFQFGRYCAVASNREGGLPSNLQGLWSEGLESPWSADYHLNINLQMNYWPVEPTGLSDLHRPMLDFVSAMQPSGCMFAKSLGLEGFCCGHAVNAWMQTRFSGNQALWSASLMNGAWVTAHMMEHYRYTGNAEFLRDQAWPVIQNNAAFVLSWLQWDDYSGDWITGPGTSPENQFIYTDGTKKIRAAVSCGNTHDLMIAWESLSDLVEAAEELDIDNALVRRAKQVLHHLAEGRIGPDGRMQEWREPFEEAMPGHRHVSHAYGFFPGRQYNTIDHPEHTRAIAASLDSRLASGGGHTGWSRAWLINIEACLRRPKAAYENVRKLISTMVNPNLFALHPPFQIDANFGYTSGVVTMLMQSQIVLDSGERLIWLLPAVPDAWSSGEVKGLRARGGAVIDLRWTPESVEARIYATRGGSFLFRCRDKTKPLQFTAGETIVLTF